MDKNDHNLILRKKGRPSHLLKGERIKLSVSVSKDTIHKMKKFLNEEQEVDFANQSHFVEKSILNLIETDGKNSYQLVKDKVLPAVLGGIFAHSILKFIFSDSVKNAISDVFHETLDNITNEI